MTTTERPDPMTLSERLVRSMATRLAGDIAEAESRADAGVDVRGDARLLERRLRRALRLIDYLDRRAV